MFASPHPTDLPNTKTNKRRKAKSKTKTAAVGTPSRLIGPEDVAPGLYVTVSRETREAVWIDDCPSTGEPTLRRETYDVWPWYSEVLKVHAVSLPFVIATTAGGEVETVDLRRQRLARVAKKVGKIAFALTKKANK